MLSKVLIQLSYCASVSTLEKHGKAGILRDLFCTRKKSGNYHGIL